MNSPIKIDDWNHFMATFPKAKPAPRKVDPLLRLGLARGTMLLALNKMKPTTSKKKIAEIEKIALLLKKFDL